MFGVGSLGLLGTQQSGGGGAADPDAVIEALFANSEVGACLDPSDLTTMFQDRAGTTPVTADGQTVGKILDKSGRGNHAVAPNDAARPLYKTSGGLHWLQFDGVNNLLATAAIDFTAVTQMSAFLGGKKSADQLFGCFFEADSAALDPGIWNRLNTYSLRVTSDEWGGIMVHAAPSTNVISAAFNTGGQATGRVDGLNDFVTAPPIAVGNFGSSVLQIGARIGAIVPLNGNIYSLIVLGRLATTQEITDTETWVAAKTGVTLP